jgi:hypothetical protein
MRWRGRTAESDAVLGTDLMNALLSGGRLGFMGSKARTDFGSHPRRGGLVLHRIVRFGSMGRIHAALDRADRWHPRTVR